MAAWSADLKNESERIMIIIYILVMLVLAPIVCVVGFWVLGWFVILAGQITDVVWAYVKNVRVLWRLRYRSKTTLEQSDKGG